MNRLFALLLVGALAGPQAATAAMPRCSLSDDNAATKAIAAAVSLSAVHQVAKHYSGCAAGGGVAEEVSDRVARLLATQWTASIRSLGGQENGALMSFVLTNINETDGEGDLQGIRRQAREECPQGLAAVCRRIERAAKLSIDGDRTR